MVISASFQEEKPNWSIFCLGKDKGRFASRIVTGGTIGLITACQIGCESFGSFISSFLHYHLVSFFLASLPAVWTAKSGNMLHLVSGENQEWVTAWFLCGNVSSAAHQIFKCMPLSTARWAWIWAPRTWSPKLIKTHCENSSCFSLSCLFTGNTAAVPWYILPRDF